MVERIGDSKRCKQFHVSEKPTPSCLDNYILIYVVYFVVCTFEYMKHDFLSILTLIYTKKKLGCF